MKISIELGDITTTVETHDDQSTEELVETVYKALLTTGHSPINIAHSMGALGEEQAEMFESN